MPGSRLPGHNAQDDEALHASCVVVGEAAVLITGDSGAGKTSLALALLETARRTNVFASLIADDRTIISARGGRLLARSHPAIAGRYELRGYGVATTVCEPVAVVRLVAHCLREAGARYPSADALHWRWRGVSVPLVEVGLDQDRTRILGLHLERTWPSCNA